MLLDKPTESKDRNTPLNYADICRGMIEQMDLGRGRWWALLKEILVNAGVKVVNTELNCNIDIGMKEEDIPDSFPFNKISGETVEAAIIGWQIQMAVDFTMKHNYIGSNQLKDFIDATVKVATKDENERWTLSFGVHFGTTSLIHEDIAHAVAYYMANKVTDNEAVTIIKKELESRGMAVLAGVTQLAVATAFSDAAMVQQIMRKMKPG